VDDTNLYCIEDVNGRKLHYHFTPASIISNFIPLVVVLHSEKTTDALHFEYKMWNVLTPLDDFKNEDGVSCWLGKEGDFGLQELLQKLIKKIAQEHECEDHIYMYGSFMGGYAAILHGMLCNANAVYAYAPYIRLEDKGGAHSDLTSLLNPAGHFPIFYLCNAGDGNSHDETTYFEEACKKYNIRVKRDFCPEVKEGEAYCLKKVLDMFERE
jgi:hypothetical protein